MTFTSFQRTGRERSAASQGLKAGRLNVIWSLTLSGLLLAFLQPAQAQMDTGSYTGDGTDDRAITGLSFQPDVVIIKGDLDEVAMMRTSTMAGDSTKPLVYQATLTANLIQSLDSNGFTVGNDAGVNSNGINYYWIAFKAATGGVKVGSYVGDRTADHGITSAAFSPTT